MYECSRVFCFTATLALTAAAALPAQLPWRAALSDAQAKARTSKRLLLVAVHEVGEAGSEAMWRQAWSDKRVVQALRDVVPALLSFVPPGQEERAAALGVGSDATLLRRESLAAAREIFGAGATVTTPQFMLLGPEGDVLAHELGATGPGAVLEALAAARGESKRSAQARASAVRRRVDQLAQSAPRDPLAYERLNVLVRNGAVAHFGVVFEVLARDPELAERLLGAAMQSQPDARRSELVDELARRRGCNALVAMARTSLAPRVVPDARAREVLAPLPALRATEDLAAVQFTDGRTRSEGNLRGQATVLLFFLPDAGDLRQQVTALAPVLEEMRARGVQCLALFGTLDPAADLDKVRALGLSCPAGTYRFERAAPFQGVGFFPASLVVDEDARVVFADDQPGDREYAAFAPTARGLVRYQVQRPRLVSAGRVADVATR